MLKLKFSITGEESNNKVSVTGLNLSGFMHEYKLGLGYDLCYLFFKKLHSRLLALNSQTHSIVILTDTVRGQTWTM